MKKLITLALATAAVFAVQAADVSVYSDGVLAVGLSPQDWWENVYDFQADNPDGSGKVFSFNAKNGGTDGSMGVIANGTDFVTGPLNSAELTFDWYAVGTGTYSIRLVAEGGIQQDFSWTVTEENANKWNSETVNVSKTFPQVAEAWKNYVGKGSGCVFGVIVSQASPDAKIYFNNVVYKDIDDSWTAPVLPDIVPPAAVPGIEQDQADVLSVFSPYGNMNFSVGSWGQSTQSEDVTISGTVVKKFTHFNYIGWEFAEHFSIADYNRMHVDFYPCEETAFGFTPISPGHENGWIAPEVKLNEWNRYDVDLTFFSSVDKSDIFQIKFDQGNNGAECYLANVYFYKVDPGSEPENPEEPASGNVYSEIVESTFEQLLNGITHEYPFELDYSVRYNDDQTLTITADFIWKSGEPEGMVAGTVFVNNQPNDFTLSGSTRTVTTTATFVANTVVPLNFYIPAAGGAVLQVPVQYVVGSKHTAATEPKLLVEVVDVTSDSAEISWEIEVPDEGFEDAIFEVKLDDEVIESSPYALTGLTPLTTYKHTLSGTATVGGETVEIAPVEIEFTTLPNGKVESVTANGSTHVMVNPINVDPYFVEIKYAITNTDDGGLTMAFTLPEGVTIPGLVPKIDCAGEHADADAATLTAKLNGPFAPAETYEITVHLAYAGNETQFTVPYTYATDNAIDEGNVFLFKPGTVTVSEDGESVEVTYDVYLSNSMEGAEVTVEWVANEVTTQASVAAEPLSGTATESPFTISGLNPNTNYTISLAARAVLDGTALSSGSAMNVQADTTTGVASLATDRADAVYYDANGVRIQNPDSGLFIKVCNGKIVKVLINK